jgi:hypothetical protein
MLDTRSLPDFSAENAGKVRPEFVLPVHLDGVAVRTTVDENLWKKTGPE